MCNRNTVRESWHISFFSGGDPFCEVMQQPENTHEGADRSAWVASGSLSFAWATTGPLLQSQIYRPYILSQVPSGNMNIFASRIFYLWLVIETYILLFFFPVICWSYPRTEISVTLSIGNELYSLPSSFPVTHFVDVILRPHWTCCVHPRHFVAS